MLSEKRNLEPIKLTIDDFLEEIDLCYERLKLVHILVQIYQQGSTEKLKRNILLLRDYLMIYEITREKEVSVSRIMSAKSNWINTLFK